MKKEFKTFYFYRLIAPKIKKDFMSQEQLKSYAKKLKLDDYQVETMIATNRTGRL